MPRTVVGRGMIGVVTAAVTGAMVLGASIFGLATPAHAQPVDMATLTCSEFVGMDQMSTVATIFWIDGFFAGQQNTTVTDMSGMGQATAAIRQACQSNPSEPVFSVIRQLGGGGQQ